MSSTDLPGSRFGDWISEGWRMFTEQWKAWVLLALGYFSVMLLPSIAVMFVAFSLAFANAAARGPYGRSAAPAFPFFILFIVAISLVVLLPLAAYFKGGMYKSAFKQMRGGRLEFRDLFSAGDRFLPLLGESILVGLITAIGSLFCIIPGFVAAGLGVSLISESFAKDEVESGHAKLIPISDMDIWRELGIVYRRDRTLPRSASAFIALAR